MLAAGVDDMYSGGTRHRGAAAACILTQMSAWAEADALSELETETVRLTVGSRYAAFPLILWQTMPYAHDHPARPSVLAWLEQRLD